MTSTTKSASVSTLRVVGLFLLAPLLGASLAGLSGTVLTTDLANPSARWLISQNLSPSWQVLQEHASNADINT
jgi:hypothetical protein